MPIMDGLACFKKLKKLDPEVKVVLTSGYSKNEKVQMLLDQGALEFIEKPFSKEVLSFAVARAMRVR
jgi:DNA-binding NtrC family response regulator